MMLRSFFFFLLSLVLVGCSTQPRMGSDTVDTVASENAGDCAVGIVEAADNLMATGQLDRFFASAPFKVQWNKPADKTLEINGERIDGSSPPLEVNIAPGYESGTVQPSTFLFPTPGCWEVQGKSGDDVFQFITRIYPHAFKSSRGGCADLDMLMENSQLVVVLEIQGKFSESVDLKWIGGHVDETWYGSTPTEYVEVLLDTETADLLEVEGKYLFFLNAEPGMAWRPPCEQRTIGRLDENGQIILLHSDQEPVWNEDTTVQLRESVQAIVQQ